jgi:hypothetical protein
MRRRQLTLPYVTRFRRNSKTARHQPGDQAEILGSSATGLTLLSENRDTALRADRLQDHWDLTASSDADAPVGTPATVRRYWRRPGDCLTASKRNLLIMKIFLEQ